MPSLTSQLRPGPRMPALFVGHGNPMHAIEDSRFARGWAEIGTALPPPAAILCVSAHWTTRGATLVNVTETPETIHDFGGFPRALYEQQYPAPGAPEAAGKTLELLARHHARSSDDWGLDHGAWSVLLRMFPKAEVPVYQLSLDLSRPVAEHYALARDLKALRELGVLVVGSGNIVHNLGALSPGGAAAGWAVEFDALMAEAISERAFGRVAEAERLGRLMRRAHPTVEHFLPLLYTLGVADDADEIGFFNQGIDLGSVSMRSVLLS